VLELFVVGVTNWLGEGIGAQVPGVWVFGFVSPCDGFLSLYFIDARGKGKKGSKIRVTVLGR
jgi:hypothetical protein